LRNKLKNPQIEREKNSATGLKKNTESICSGSYKAVVEKLGEICETLASFFGVEGIRWVCVTDLGRSYEEWMIFACNIIYIHLNAAFSRSSELIKELYQLG